jgi:hypothetical protein
MILLVEAERDDTVGVLLRSLFETWVYGSYGPHGGSEAIVDLQANEDAWAAELEEFTSLTIPWGVRC